MVKKKELKGTIKMLPYNKWEDVPFVKITEHLKQQEWFKKAGGKVGEELAAAKKYWDKDVTNFPSYFILLFPYSNRVKIQIFVQWQVKKTSKGKTWQQACVSVNSPNCPTYGTNYSKKYKRSSTYQGTLKRIEEAYTTVLPWAKKQHDIIEDRARMQEEMQKTIKHKNEFLQKELGLSDPLHFNGCFNKNVNFEFNQNKTNTALIKIPLEKEKSEDFHVTVSGVFTLDEIKQLMETLTTSQRYILERLGAVDSQRF